MSDNVIIAVLCTLIASSGFWALIMKFLDKKSAKTKMLLGLGHDRIIFLCVKFIERGSIMQSEYENLNKYLFEPYKAMSGNGTAARLMEEVKKLPIVADKY